MSYRILLIAIASGLTATQARCEPQHGSERPTDACRAAPRLSNAAASALAALGEAGPSVVENRLVMVASGPALGGGVGPMRAQGRFTSESQLMASWVHWQELLGANDVKPADTSAWKAYPGVQGPRDIHMATYSFCIPGSSAPRVLTLTRSLESSANSGPPRYLMGVQVL